MKTRHVGMLMAGSRGLGSIQLLIVVGVVALLAYAGWQLWWVRGQVTGSYSVLSQRDIFGAAKGQVTEFYSCVDSTGEFTAGLPQTCTFQDNTYKRPPDFSDDNIRNFDRVPESAKATVRVIARKNFAICNDVPETFSVTKVLNVVDKHVYLATGCDGGYAAVLERQGLAWREINLGQGGVACVTAREHRMPRALFYNPNVEGSGDCFEPNGRRQALPESW